MQAPRTLGRVLSAGDASLYQDAAEALAMAEDEARSIREAAAREAAAARAAYLAEADREAQARAGLLLAETARAVQVRLAGLQAELGAAIADGVARVIGGIDLAESVALAAAQAVAGISQTHAATVRVAPEAAAVVARHLAPWGDALRVVPDEQLAADGCVVESEAGFVRADLSAQLAALRAALQAPDLAEADNA